MAKRRQRDESSVSLFPFLSILACIIGVLTLLISALAIGQLERRQDPEVVERARQAEELKRQIAAAEDELELMQSRIVRADRIEAELARAIENLKKLQEEYEIRQRQAQDNEALKEKLAAESERLKRRTIELEVDVARLEDELKRASEELAERRKPSSPDVQIRPGGTGIDIEPAFVECRSEGIVIHAGQQPTAVPRAELPKSGQFGALLEGVKSQPRGVVIFLIRSDALATYEQASQIATNRYCRNGKLPVVGEGNIDLSVFRQ